MRKQGSRSQVSWYDIIGNVWEWCDDSWHEDYNGALCDGAPSLNTSHRRGGWWIDFEAFHIFKCFAEVSGTCGV